MFYVYHIILPTFDIQPQVCVIHKALMKYDFLTVFKNNSVFCKIQTFLGTQYILEKKNSLVIKDGNRLKIQNNEFTLKSIKFVDTNVCGLWLYFHGSSAKVSKYLLNS